MNEYFDDRPHFTIAINPPGKQEDMISVIEPVQLTRHADDQAHRPDQTAPTSLSDPQEDLTP